MPKIPLTLLFQSSLTALVYATDLTLAAGSALGETNLEVEVLGSTSNAQTPSVSLLVDVLDEQNIPIEGLKSSDFIVKTAPISQRDPEGNPTDLRFEPVQFQLLPPSQQRNPDPAMIITLLDMSGSMEENDSSGSQKFASALEAIRQFSGWLQQSNLREKTYLAVVPFSIGANCDRLVTSEVLTNSLVPVTDPAINQQLDQLSSLTPCGATNLYSSVSSSVNFLRQQFLSNNGINLSQYSQLEPLDKPRLVIIVFSDGFDTESRGSGQEVEQFEDLKNLIDSTSAITVHTLGYGDSLETVVNHPDTTAQNRSSIPCNQVVTQEALRNSERPLDLVREQCNVNNALLVDAPRLEAMTGDRGIYRFPRTAAEVEEAFEYFFNSLRRYEIEYYQADAQEGQEYQIQVALREGHPIAPAEDTTRFRFPPILLRPLPASQRYGILLGTLIALAAVVRYFVSWSNRQRQDMERMI